MYEWSDLRIFIAVVRAASALGAAKTLGVNQTTVNRRIQALEHQLGLMLFDRKNRGHALTEHGKALLGSAQRVAQSANNLSSAAERIRRTLDGVVRITAPEEISTAVIIPIVAEFQKQHREVRVEQVATDQKLDIVHGEADIAIRNGSHPDDDRLIAQRLPDFAWSLYCSRSYAAENGMPNDISKLSDHDYVGYADSVNKWGPYRWFMEIARPKRLVSRSNTVPNMRAALRSGLGVGLLP